MTETIDSACSLTQNNQEELGNKTTMNKYELKSEKAVKQAKLTDIKEQNTVNGVLSLSEEVATQVKSISEEIKVLTTKIEEMEELEKSLETNSSDHYKSVNIHDPIPERPTNRRETEIKTLQDHMLDSKDFRHWASRRGDGRFQIDIEPQKGCGLKTLMTTSAGWAAPTIRSNIVAEAVTAQPHILDIIPEYATNANSLNYMQETTFTNNAAETVESSGYGENAEAFTSRNAVLQNFAVFLPVTDQQLEDIDGITQFLNDRLVFSLRQKIGSQIFVGSGSGAQITGFLNASTTTTAYSTGVGDLSAADAILRGYSATVGATGQIQPNYLVMNPANYFALINIKNTTNDPVVKAYVDGVSQRIHGLPVILTTQITANTALLGFFGDCLWAYKGGIQLKSSDSDDQDFQRGRVKIRASTRGALAVTRPTSFCTMTSLP